jgi:hypothetical protein
VGEKFGVVAMLRRVRMRGLVKRLGGVATVLGLAAGMALLAPAAPASAAGCTPRTGPYQKIVESYLKLRVDGVASYADCVAVRNFQRRYDIRPAAGYAGPLTYNVVGRLAWANFRSCAFSYHTRVCVDLSRQVMWVTKANKRLYGPVPIRTGRRGLATPAGYFSITEKKISTTSSIFKVKLPYWQRFYRDMGFHQSTTWLYDPKIPGSHGCINLLATDARALYNLTARGTSVHIFGRKPGT